MTDQPAAREARPSEPGSSTSGLVPDWLQNMAALSWRILVIAVFVVVLWLVASTLWTITAAIAVAVVVSAVFAPFVLKLRDGGRSRTSAAGIVWAVAILTIGGVLLLLILAFLPYVVDLLSKLSEGVDAFKASLEDVNAPDWVSALPEDIVDKAGDVGGDIVGSIVASAASVGTILILATFLIFFFLRDGDKAWLWCFQSLGPDKLERITTAGDDALARVGGYLRGTTVLGIVVALTNYLFMFVLGVPLALPLALLSFVAMFIPYFGSILTNIVILLVTFGALGMGPAVAMLVLLGIRSLIVNYGIRPAVYGRTVSMHPALVLIVLPAGFALGGLVGLFAAVPITAVILAVAQSAIDIIEPDPAPPLPEVVPAWLDRVAQWSWRLLVAIGLVVLLVFILTTVPVVVIPVVLALIFAATLQPVVTWIEGRGHAHARATAIAVATTTFAIIGVLALTLVSLVGQADELGRATESGAQSINEAAGGNLGLGEDAISAGVGSVVDAITGLGQGLAALATVVLLSVLLTYYFLRDGANWWSKLMSQTHSEAAVGLTAAGSKAFSVLGGYMTGTAAISFVGAASQLAIMVILDLPLAMPVFVLSFFGGFIPYIGSLLTTGLAFLIAVAFGDTVDIVVMAIWTVVFNLVQGNIVSPVVYGRTTHIHPAIVLVAIPAASTVAGILGMFIVVPAIGVVAATWRTVLAVIGGDPMPVEAADDPDPEPPTDAAMTTEAATPGST